MRSRERASLGALERLRLLGEIFASYAHARWLLLRGDLPSAVAGVRARAARRSSPNALVNDDPRRLVSISIRVLQRIPFDSRCLMRSLVVLGMLARRGVETRLVIGVELESGFAAHAWLERDGIAVLPAGSFASGRLTAL
jgi:Transglutaminase-like superfamily